MHLPPQAATQSRDEAEIRTQPERSFTAMHAALLLRRLGRARSSLSLTLRTQAARLSGARLTPRFHGQACVSDPRRIAPSPCAQADLQQVLAAAERGDVRTLESLLRESPALLNGTNQARAHIGVCVALVAQGSPNAFPLWFALQTPMLALPCYRWRRTKRPPCAARWRPGSWRRSLRFWRWARTRRRRTACALALPRPLLRPTTAPHNPPAPPCTQTCSKLTLSPSVRHDRAPLVGRAPPR